MEQLTIIVVTYCLFFFLLIAGALGIAALVLHRDRERRREIEAAERRRIERREDFEMDRIRSADAFRYRRELLKLGGGVPREAAADSWELIPDCRSYTNPADRR
jgi:hypothetical protein